jgi:hypothetical protein
VTQAKQQLIKYSVLTLHFRTCCKPNPAKEMLHLCNKPEKDPFQLETSDLGGILALNDSSGILKHLTKIHHSQKRCPKGYERKHLNPKKSCNDKFNLRLNDKGEVEIHASMIKKTFGPTDFCLIFEDNQMLSAVVCQKIKQRQHIFG